MNRFTFFNQYFLAGVVQCLDLSEYFVGELETWKKRKSLIQTLFWRFCNIIPTLQQPFLFPGHTLTYPTKGFSVLTVWSVGTILRPSFKYSLGKIADGPSSPWFTTRMGPPWFSVMRLRDLLWIWLRRFGSVFAWMKLSLGLKWNNSIVSRRSLWQE